MCCMCIGKKSVSCKFVIYEKNNREIKRKCNKKILKYGCCKFF